MNLILLNFLIVISLNYFTNATIPARLHKYISYVPTINGYTINGVKYDYSLMELRFDYYDDIQVPTDSFKYFHLSQSYGADIEGAGNSCLTKNNAYTMFMIDRNGACGIKHYVAFMLSNNDICFKNSYYVIKFAVRFFQDYKTAETFSNLLSNVVFTRFNPFSVEKFIGSTTLLNQPLKSFILGIDPSSISGPKSQC